VFVPGKPFQPSLMFADKARRPGDYTNEAPGAVFTRPHFFFTYEWSQRAGVLHYTVLNRLSRGKHSSLFGEFDSYAENEVLRIQPLGAYSHNLIFCATYEKVQ
jgi:hypothetical protein